MKSELRQSGRNLGRLLLRFRKLRIGVLGDVMLDRYVWGEATRLSPEAAVPVVNYVSQRDFPGGAGNVAANIAALGAQVKAFGVVGADQSGKDSSGRAKRVPPDEVGRALHACLRALGVADHGIIADQSRITTLKTRIIARRHQIVRIDRERWDPLPASTEERLFRLILGALKNLDGLVLSDYDKGLLGDSLVERVVGAAHRLEVPVFVKPKTSRLLAYRGARAVVCNAKEAAHYAGQAVTTESSIEETGRALLGRFGCAAVVITRTEHGMSIFEENSRGHLHIPAVSFELTYARVGQPGGGHHQQGRQVYDVTGAGDTVLSVLALALAAGADLMGAAMLANTAAGVVVGKLGTATVSPPELAAALKEISE